MDASGQGNAGNDPEASQAAPRRSTDGLIGRISRWPPAKALPCDLEASVDRRGLRRCLVLSHHIWVELPWTNEEPIDSAKGGFDQLLGRR
jgi:hypothetical protein